MALVTSWRLTNGQIIEVGASALASGSSGQLVELNATTKRIQGLTKTALASQLAGINDTLTLAPDNAFSWDSADLNVAVTHAAGVCSVTLPSATQLTNWPVGGQIRRLFKMNASANGINLLAPADVAINGAALDADMSPIPDSNTTPSNTVLAQVVMVYRVSAASFYVFGAS